MKENPFFSNCSVNRFAYFQRKKLNQYFRCPMECSFKEEEIFKYCGEKGFCEYLNQEYSKIQLDKDQFFKYR
jgi:hypothetical protein